MDGYLFLLAFVRVTMGPAPVAMSALPFRFVGNIKTFKVAHFHFFFIGNLQNHLRPTCDVV